MLPSESPFPCQWWGTGLEVAGLDDVRPDVGTYGRYEFELLPPLPFELRGDFAWLASAPAHEHSVRDEKVAENAAALSSLYEFAERLGLPLPAEFTKFMESAELQQRVRSVTDCFLDVCPEPIRSPIGGGWLIRFLADSQGCLFWYLYLTPDGTDHAVVASLAFYGAEVEQRQDEPPDPPEIVYNAGSFEAFMCRSWLESEIWLCTWEKTRMPEVCQEYIERYQRAGS